MIDENPQFAENGWVLGASDRVSKLYDEIFIYDDV